MRGRPKQGRCTEKAMLDFSGGVHSQAAPRRHFLDAASLTPLSPQNVLRDVIASCVRESGELSGTGSMRFVVDWQRTSEHSVLTT